MTKKYEISKDKVICEIMSAVFEQNTIDVVREKTVEILKRYFPDSDEIFKNIFIGFALIMQDAASYIRAIKIEVNRYEREQRHKAK